MVKCPYCGNEVEINHDDGYGYEESETFEQECAICYKTFIFNTFIDFHYSLSKAPCKNGGPHNLKSIVGGPHELYVGKKRCSVCAEIITVDEEAHVRAMHELVEKYNNAKTVL